MQQSNWVIGLIKGRMFCKEHTYLFDFCLGAWILNCTWVLKWHLHVKQNCVYCCFSVTKPCPTHCDPMDCSPPGSPVHGILQARILEWVAMLSSRESYQPRNWTQVSRIAGEFFTIWAIREAPLFSWGKALMESWHHKNYFWNYSNSLSFLQWDLR